MSITPATLDDIPELLILIESSYRGVISTLGWSSEAHLVGDTRTTPELLKTDMSKPGAVLLKYSDASGRIIGCVYTRKEEEQMYTGLLCVYPKMQTNGFGKQLVAAVEALAKKSQCTEVKIDVISRRTELLEWYERRGFVKTGEFVPFPSIEGFGVAKIPLELVIMKKQV